VQQQSLSGLTTFELVEGIRVVSSKFPMYILYQIHLLLYMSVLSQDAIETLTRSSTCRQAKYIILSASLEILFFFFEVVGELPTIILY
jgi:hypothetical protein